MRVRANAETPLDATTARDFGAEGIGLCRTEHMFFDAERIIAVREMILAETKGGREAALAKLLPMQRSDFVKIFEAMRGLRKSIAEELGASFEPLEAGERGSDDGRFSPEPDGEGGVRSSFGVRVDRFYIAGDGLTWEQEYMPFIVDGGDVYMDEALIRHAAIKNAQIANLAADKIFAASGTIAEAIIGEAEITNAMIEEYRRWRDAYWITGPGSEQRIITYWRKGQAVRRPMRRGPPAQSTKVAEGVVLRGIFDTALRDGFIRQWRTPNL